MSPVQNVLRQLVERRLWPVAIVLVAALAAVPLMLAKDPEPVPPPPAPAADSAGGQLASEPIVALATAEPDAKRRKVLGSAKNPFKAKASQTDEPAADGGAATPAPAAPQPDVPESGAGGATPDAGAPPSTGAPTVPAAPVEPVVPPKTYEPEELTVRFGGAEGTAKRSVTKLDPLPSAALPVLIYMGVLKDGKTAEFLLDAGVKAVGDGECAPSPEACETLRLRVGETEFLDVVDDAGEVTEQYQLDLLKIHNVKKHSDSSPTRTRSGLKSAARRTKLRSVAGRVSANLP
jgi:hypothetical protein